jgi:hypothetical protein
LFLISDRTFEIRDAQELLESITAELSEKEAEFGAGSASAKITFSKPQRPGKGARPATKSNKLFGDFL